MTAGPCHLTSGTTDTPAGRDMVQVSVKEEPAKAGTGAVTTTDGASGVSGGLCGRRCSGWLLNSYMERSEDM